MVNIFQCRNWNAAHVFAYHGISYTIYPFSGIYRGRTYKCCFNTKSYEFYLSVSSCPFLVSMHHTSVKVKAHHFYLHDVLYHWIVHYNQFDDSEEEEEEKNDALSLSFLFSVVELFLNKKKKPFTQRNTLVKLNFQFNHSSLRSLVFCCFCCCFKQTQNFK